MGTPGTCVTAFPRVERAGRSKARTRLAALARVLEFAKERGPTTAEPA